MNKELTHKWIENMLIFLAPLGVLYLTQVIGTFQQPDNILEWSDFYPSQITIGGMILYVLNSIMDFLRKYKKSITE